MVPECSGGKNTMYSSKYLFIDFMAIEIRLKEANKGVQRFDPNHT